MAKILFSTITNGDEVAFSPKDDILFFDDTSIIARSVVVSYSSTFDKVGFVVGYENEPGYKKFTLTPTVLLTELTAPSNNNGGDVFPGDRVEFADGSKLAIGDWTSPNSDGRMTLFVNNTLLGTGLDDQLLGLTGSDTLGGGRGNDLLDGGTGNDLMIGGSGGDIYVVDSSADFVDETASVNTSLESSNSQGQQGNNASQKPQISADGRFVVFQSSASDLLVEGDANGADAIFVKELAPNGNVQRASIDASDSVPTDKLSSDAQISATGQYVLFTSSASNLVAGDTNDRADIFVKNMETGAIQRASTSVTGVQGNGSSELGQITANGRMAVFESNSNNLVSGDDNNSTDVFFKQLDSPRTVEIVSTSSSRKLGNSSSFDADVSDDGRFVVFSSAADNLVEGDSNTQTDIFLKDRSDGSTIRVSTNADGEEANGLSRFGQVSADGHLVLFQSDASNLGGGVPGVTDIFLKDVQTGVVKLVSATAGGVGGNADSTDAQMSADGRYVVFQSRSSNFVQGDTNSRADVFVKDMDTGAIVRVSVDEFGIAPNSDINANYMVGGFSADGKKLVFSSTADTLTSGDKNNRSDVFLIRNPFLAEDDGSDTVRSSVSYTLPNHVENLELTGDSAINGTGNELDNQLRGNSAKNILRGGLGDDVYWVDSAEDVIDESTTDPREFDIVISTVSWTLGANLENLEQQGSAAIDGVGNAAVNRLVGNDASNKFYGMEGNDSLEGNGGNDTLDGGAGFDTMEGGQGNDTYVVNSGGDVVVERSTAAGEIDLVLSRVNWTLGSNLEHLRLTGSNPINGTGNGAANVLIGNSVNNTLKGMEGNDSLVGNAGNDTLDGGAGFDTMDGGAGNDIYVVNSGGDRVVEKSTAAGEIDLVLSRVNWTLGANLENLSLTGSAAINGTGNTLANTITGNGGSNRLLGGAGNDSLNGGVGVDTMLGGVGNDTYYVDNTGDKVYETTTVGGSTNAGGTDTVRSSVSYTLGSFVEKLLLTGSGTINGTGNSLANTITGNAGKNVLSGSSGNDTLSGGAGNDRLVGGTGNDSLTGGTGLDVYRFNTTLNATTNRDRITDFVVADDTIQLENAVFTKLTTTGTLASGRLRIGTAAADSNDYLIYNPSTGALSYDADGSGAAAAVQFATLGTGLALTVSDFFII